MTDVPDPLRWTPQDIPDQTGRTAVVTGATSGLGLLVTRHLLKHGAHVIMAARNRGKAEQVQADLRRSAPVGTLEIGELDVLDLDSVRRFAAELAGRRVDLLVNNAGIANQPRRLSPQGHESQMATNHLGHAALTGRLLAQLAAGQAPRVVTVGSNLYTRVRVTLDPDDLDADRKPHSPAMAYARSKVAQMLFAVELQRRLAAVGSPVRSLVAHPGMALTPMQDHVNTWRDRALQGLMAALLARPAEQAVRPLLYASTAPEAPTHLSIGPVGSRRDSLVGFAELQAPVNDEDLAARLWEATERLTGVAAPIR